MVDVGFLGCALAALVTIVPIRLAPLGAYRIDFHCIALVLPATHGDWYEPPDFGSGAWTVQIIEEARLVMARITQLDYVLFPVAAEPLRPKARQRPADHGLFSDESKQTDLVDRANARDT
jgi:hypothetical protein